MKSKLTPASCKNLYCQTIHTAQSISPVKAVCVKIPMVFFIILGGKPS